MLTKNQIICINMSFHDSKSVGQAGLGQGTAVVLVEVFVRDDKPEVQDRLKAVFAVEQVQGGYPIDNIGNLHRLGCHSVKINLGTCWY